MGIFFEPYQAEGCCLCGAGEALTGEHKIKASTLREIFGRDAMTIGNFDDESIRRLAQGPKSRAFHFSARMRSEEHTSELQSLMRNSYAVFCLKKKKNNQK